MAGEDEQKKSIGIVSALCVFSLAISPIYSVIDSLNDGVLKADVLADVADSSDVYKDIYVSYLCAETKEELEGQVLDMLVEKYNIPKDGISVEIFLDEEFNVSFAALYVHPNGVFADPEPMADYLGELLSCKCQIIYDKNTKK